MGIFGDKDKLQLIAFQAYGTDKHFYARGRALEDEEIDLAQKGILPLLWNAFKRFETDEIRHTTLLLTLSDGRTLKATTDKKGYYRIEENIEDLKKLTNQEGWLHYTISYADADLKREIIHQNKFPGELLIPSEKAEFGVISDIDDTILHTGVVSNLKWKVIVNTLFKRAGSRLPLEGSPELYHLLHRGKSGNNANPIFYVSHSPWNLYRYLEFFLSENNFPKGPILLRNFPSLRRRNKDSEKPQKHKEILNILKTYPTLKFILIGDSGEHDADIYIEIASAYPDQIAAIYLRTVNHKKKMMRVNELVKDFEISPVLLVESSKQAIEHARTNSFIK